MRIFQKPNIEKSFSTLAEAESFISNHIKNDKNDKLTSVSNGQLFDDIDIIFDDFKHYETEFYDKIVNVTLYMSKDQYLVHVWITYKHPMISAAVLDNIELFKEKFVNNEIKVNLAFKLSLEHNCESIYRWLICNIPITNDPIYRAIFYDKVEALDLLLKNNYEMKSNWLIQAVENKSLKIINEFLYKRKFKSQSVNSAYFHSRVIQSNFPDLDKLIAFITVNYGYKNKN